MPCVYLCVHDLWKVISWVHHCPFFVEFHYEKNAINPRCAIVIYHSLYLVIFLYMQKKFLCFFFFSSTQVSCSVVTVPWLADRYFSGGGQWRGRQSLDRDHPPPPAVNLAAWTGVTIVLLCLSIPLPGVCVQSSSYARPTTEGDPRLSWLKYPN